MTRDELHARLRRNALIRDALRTPIYAAIVAGSGEAPEAEQMRRVLADDERLRPLHERLCSDTRTACGL